MQSYRLSVAFYCTSIARKASRRLQVWLQSVRHLDMTWTIWHSEHLLKLEVQQTPRRNYLFKIRAQLPQLAAYDPSHPVSRANELQVAHLQELLASSETTHLSPYRIFHRSSCDVCQAESLTLFDIPLCHHVCPGPLFVRVAKGFRLTSPGLYPFDSVLGGPVTLNPTSVLHRTCVQGERLERGRRGE